MKEMSLVESDFYCEMTLPGKSPLNIEYPSYMLNKLYLFNHIYYKNDECHLDEVNETTIQTYQKHNILTVSLVRTCESFSLDDFDDLMNCLMDKTIEGFMLSQQNCLIKLKTHYYEASILDLGSIKINENDQYQLNLKCCFEKYIKAINRAKKNDSGYNHNNIIDCEIEKEYGHDDHSEFVIEYFLKSMETRSQFLKESDLAQRIFKSIEKDLAFVTTHHDTILKKLNDFLRNKYFI
jgi:hypothetical protein